MKIEREKVRFEKNNALVFHANSDVNAHPHWHGAVKILYVLKGTFMQQIDSHMVQIKKGDLVIIWSNQIHSTYTMNQDEEDILVLQFKFNHLDLDLINISFYDKLQDRTIVEYLLKIESCMRQKEIGYRYETEGKIYGLLSYIVKAKQQLPITKSNETNYHEMIAKVFEYMDHNYRNPLTLADGAQHVHLSVPQFSRVFKKCTGCTYKKYLNMYRINKSIQFLEEGKSVAQTAFLCGFDNTNTYIRLFKQLKDTTPLQYKSKR